MVVKGAGAPSVLLLLLLLLLAGRASALNLGAHAGVNQGWPPGPASRDADDAAGNATDPDLWVRLHDVLPLLLAYSTRWERSLLPRQIGAVWVEIRAAVVAPVLKAAVVVCLVMSVMLVSEVLYLNAVSFGVKLLRRRPESRYKWEPFDRGDLEAGGGGAFPMVLVQIPMYNEKEVYKLSIGAACSLAWPRHRIIIQVLDDSTDPDVKELVECECEGWASKGVNIKYEVRDNRRGYKAGALRRGMERRYVHLCEFVAVFDADFQPESDFLVRTIPFLIHNPDVALVQARWDFVNFKECLMTRIQKMSLDYHFKVEQEAGSAAYAFFGFNGTAGVWRISALHEAGGWKDRTTVEDMDLAVRASLKGWKFVYAGDVKVKSELPSTFKAYRHQQHRWTCGGANLFRKMGSEVLRNKSRKSPCGRSSM